MANLPTTLNNPGDLKGAGKLLAFNDPLEGKAALYNDLTAKMTGKSKYVTPSSSLVDFSKAYAPESDGNDPLQYAANLANKLGVSPDTKIGTLTGRIDEFANAISQNEGYDPSGYITHAQLPPKPTSAPIDTAQPDTFNQQIQNRLTQAGTALTSAAKGEINPLSGVLQGVGAGAGFLGDVTGDVLNLIPGVKQITGAIGKGVGSLAQTQPGQALVQAGQQFAQEHPEAAGNIGAVGNIVTALPIVQGIRGVGGLVGKALGKEALSGVVEDIAPQLGPKGVASAIVKGGTTKSFLTGEIKTAIEPELKNIAKTVVEEIPNFTKLGTFSDKINAVQDAIDSIATKLRNQVIDTGSDRLYSFKELNSTLRGLEKPMLITAENLDNVYDRVIAKAVEIAKNNKGTISGLFDSRKEFDYFIKQTFPNLYASDKLTGMRVAVRDIRGAINDMIEKRLPKGSGFRDSLRTQSRLFNAVDNMAPKAVKEIGSTRFSRFKKRHPLLTGAIKNVARGAAYTAGAGSVYEGGKGLLGALFGHNNQ